MWEVKGITSEGKHVHALLLNCVDATDAIEQSFKAGIAEHFAVYLSRFAEFFECDTSVDAITYQVSFKTAQINEKGKRRTISYKWAINAGSFEDAQREANERLAQGYDNVTICSIKDTSVSMII